MTPSDEHSAELKGHVDHGAVCLTCGDTATWLRVVEVDRGRDLALCVDEGEHRYTVDTGIAGAVAPGDRLLVHGGTALRREPA